ncbi:MAG: hypothetical protein LAT54_02260 [Cryomorphaceae bacterium]|nr:hypothetical protein [Cryomorphaceae bacterium]
MKPFYLTSIVLLTFITWSCENYKEENESLKLELENAQNRMLEQESLINDFSETMFVVQQNLSDIKQREKSIQDAASLGSENLKNTRQDVINDLEAIALMMDENKETIEDLNRKFRASGSQNNKLKKVIDQLSAEISQKDSSIVALRSNLEKSNFRIAELQGQMDVLREKKEREIAKKEDELNRAFYISGDYKTLEEKEVVDKAGGFIGIGRVKTLQDDLKKDDFTEIDKRTFERLSLEAKKAELLTPHPSSSYEFEIEDKQIKALVVKDKEAFWRSTSTLVILLK